MKQLIIGVILAVCLVGCGEKPQFTINESDTNDTYANNPAFKVVNKEDDSILYYFYTPPQSVYGLKTDDLSFIEGTVVTQLGHQKDISMQFKDESNFNILKNRLAEAKWFRSYACKDDSIQFGGYAYLCENNNQRRISIIYSSQLQIVLFIINRTFEPK